jgi:hypothetical protein
MARLLGGLFSLAQISREFIVEERAMDSTTAQIVGMLKESGTSEGRLKTVNRAPARILRYESPQALLETVIDIRNIYVEPGVEPWVEPGHRGVLKDPIGPVSHPGLDGFAQPGFKSR